MQIKCILTLLMLFAFTAPYSIAQKADQQSTEKDLNPALMQGSDFLTVFQLYYKQGNWDKMMEMTSQKSIRKYGYKAILCYYKQMEFGYKIRLISTKKTPSGYLMNYQAKIQATDIVLRCEVVVEGGNLRLVLQMKLSQHVVFLFRK